MSFPLNLKSLLKVLDITAKQIADETGLNYFTINTTINGDRKGRAPRTAIAKCLNIPYDHLWGNASARYTKQLIERAIDRRVKQDAKITRNRLKKQYLNQSLPASKQVING